MRSGFVVALVLAAGCGSASDLGDTRGSVASADGPATSDTCCDAGDAALPPVPDAGPPLDPVATDAATPGDTFGTAGACVLNSDCPNPLGCVFGRCHIACVLSRDCARGSRCLRTSIGVSVCQLPEETACPGGACPTPLACGGDHQCRNQCQSDVDCHKDEHCIDNFCLLASESSPGHL